MADDKFKALDAIRAFKQWVAQYVVRMLMVFVGLVACAIGCTRIVYSVNPYGLRDAIHDAKYIAAGSSGSWLYATFRDAVLLPWSNYEDGLRGEPSGKWSARRKGKEATWLSMWFWSAVRNPVNYASRVWAFFAVHLADVASIDYWGDYIIDKHSSKWIQWHMVRTTTLDGRRYYGFRMKVRYLPWLFLVGSKVKPIHRHGDDLDDQRKGCTFRLWFLDWVVIGVLVYYYFV